jgi:hypothetical protein
MDWTTWLKVIGVSGASAVAFVSVTSRFFGDYWFGKLLAKQKAEYDREIEKQKAGFAQGLEHYRALLDRSIFVTRAHFETEFTAMKEVSQRLSEVKIAFGRFHPKQVAS